MKNFSFYLAFFGLVIMLALVACEKEKDLPYKGEVLNLPETPYSYANPEIPPHIGVRGADLGITDAGATLGRVIFYDTKLSLNNKVACASCHLQEHAFADPVALSEGFEGQLTTRNAMSLVNLFNKGDFFWDSRETNLEEMVLRPVKNHIEMGMENLGDLKVKLHATSFYPELFDEAFGTSEITEARIGDAISQFLRSMVSADSKYDEYQASFDFNVFTFQEKEGLFLFFGEARCGECHGGPDLRSSPWDFGFPGGNGGSAANIGLEMEYADNGIGTQLGIEGMNGMFAIPSLRNVALTAPYMHDGRFQSLEEVVEHYNSQIVAHPNLDFRLQDWNTGLPWRGNLSSSQKEAIVAFLHTFTDRSVTEDKRFANPFGE